MRALITSGGTKIPIDPVRDITNKSKGTFGSEIATEALERLYDVVFMRAKDSKSPFTCNLDFHRNSTNCFSEIQKIVNLMVSTNPYPLYIEDIYETYEEYSAKLKINCKVGPPEIIILAAAVSDYLVANPSDKKIKSNEDLNIKLEYAEKLIGNVKKWAPNSKLVGFKMLAGSTESELIDASRQSIEKNGCDLVVANEWNNIKNGNYERLIVTKDSIDCVKDNQAKFLWDKIEKLL